MTREEQDKNWAELSEESKYHYQIEYKNRLEDSKREIEDPEGGFDLTVTTSQNIADDLEKVFGKHNLSPSLTYEDVERELFATRIEIDYRFATISYMGIKWDNKIQAIGKLLVVAKYLNRNEDGSDWVPNWEDMNEGIWYLCIYKNKVEAHHTHTSLLNWSIVYFRTEELAKQAILILGEDVVRTAFDNY